MSSPDQPVRSGFFRFGVAQFQKLVCAAQPRNWANVLSPAFLHAFNPSPLRTKASLYLAWIVLLRAHSDLRRLKLSKTRWIQPEPYLRIWMRHNIFYEFFSISCEIFSSPVFRSKYSENLMQCLFFVSPWTRTPEKSHHIPISSEHFQLDWR